MSAATTPTITYKTELHYSSTSTGTYAKLVDIKSYPDLGSAPDLVETTTLSDAIRTYTMGLQGSDGLTFTANYISGDFDTIKALEGSTPLYFKLQFGDAGADGIFSFSGTINVRVTGGEVNAVREMEITIALNSAITKS